METASIIAGPRRITDIIEAKAAGAALHVEVGFEILPADFHHGSSPFRAYIFLARYHGTIDGAPFEFRKCYARGCPNNLCTHVSQAVNIANRYLQRDYRTLKTAGIEMDEILFTLDAMVVKFDQLEASDQPALTIDELVGLARAGNKIAVDLVLDYMPAVEHFANQQNAQTFLSGEFTARVADKTYKAQRCFACFPTDRSAEEKPMAIKVANARLELIFQAFERVGIRHQPDFFQ
jgi:hypothetical protein